MNESSTHVSFVYVKQERSTKAKNLIILKYFIFWLYDKFVCVIVFSWFQGLLALF